MKKILASSIALTVLMSGTQVVLQEQTTQAATSKVTYKTITKKTVTKYATKKVKTNDLLVGETKVKVKGKNGYKLKVYKQTLKNGKVIKTTYVKTKKTVKPVTKVILVGTKEVTKPQITKPAGYIDQPSKPKAPVEKNELLIIKQPVDYDTQYIDDPTLPLGERIVEREGKKGEREKAYNQRIIDGKEVSTTPAYVRLVTHPVNAIVRIGTRVEKLITAGIDKKYQDGRYNVDTLGSYHGYLVGKTTFRGDKITKVELKVDKPLNELALESDDDKARKAADNNLVNKVWMNTDNLVIWMEANHSVIQAFNNGKIFNNQKFNDEMVRLINIDRVAKGLNPIEYRPFMQDGADIRAKELAEYGSITVNNKAHVRLNGDIYKTAFSPEIALKVNGENTLARTYSGNPYELVSEKYLAKQCFEIWKNSPGHYAQMMAPDFKGVTTSIKLGVGKSRSTLVVANQNFSKE